MFKASANVVMPTSIIGSLPRPAWHDIVLGATSFMEAMVHARWREQYEDAVSVHLRAQETAGLDIVTDGDAHYDEQVSGLSWQTYAPMHMSGFDKTPKPTVYNIGAVAYPRGHILHDNLEARVLPTITGPVGRGGEALHVVGRVALPAHAADLLVVMGVAVGDDVEAGRLLVAQMHRNRVLVLLAIARVHHRLEKALAAEHGRVPGRPRQRADDRGRQHGAGGSFVHGRNVPSDGSWRGVR
ncbi:MAG: hypothetical protein JO021_08350, partial [Alphaproteobacteria bacterium]|nr:hypothetical protein [Alphaproteobacteria bacterium]